MEATNTRSQRFQGTPYIYIYIRSWFATSRYTSSGVGAGGSVGGADFGSGVSDGVDADEVAGFEGGGCLEVGFVGGGVGLAS